MIVIFEFVLGDKFFVLFFIWIRKFFYGLNIIYVIKFNYLINRYCKDL